MRRWLIAVCLAALAAPGALAQEADVPLEGARPAAASAPSDYAAILALDICAAIVANGAQRVGPTIAASPNLRVSAQQPISQLPREISASTARMLAAEPNTIVRMIRPPETVEAEAPFLAIARMDAQSCVVVARGLTDALGPVFVRLAQPESGWTHADERDGAHLYRRANALRMILAPRQSAEGADQVIVFREAPAGPPAPPR